MSDAEKGLENRKEKEERCAALVKEIQTGNTELLETLWQEMRPLCAWGSRRIYQQFPHSFQLEFDDIFQCGYIALCEAVKHANPEKIEGFFSYYLYYLAFSVYRENGLMKGGKDENGRRRFDPCVSTDTLSMDAPFHDSDEDNDRTLSSFIADHFDSIDRIVRSVYLRQLRDFLETLIRKLPLDEQIVIRRLYYVGETHKEIAAALRITPVETRKIEDKALIRLRKYGTENGIEQFLDGGGVRKAGGGADRLAKLKEKYRQPLS